MNAFRRLLPAAVAGLLFAAAPVSAATESEPNDTAGNADRFTAPDVLTGGLPGSFGGDFADPFVEDYWVFDAVQGAQYTFVAEGGTPEFPLDLGLVLLDAATEDPIVVQNSQGLNQGETLAWTSDRDGDVILVVFESDSIRNLAENYTVSVTTNLPDESDLWALY